MKRFQQWISDARLGPSPWDAFPEAAIARIARQCEATDIADILVEMEHLSAEKNALPAWDGDAQDDVAKAQELLACILAAVAEPLRAQVAKGLESPDALTGAYVQEALNAGARQRPAPASWLSRFWRR